MYGIKVKVEGRGKNFKGLDFLTKSGLQIGILPEDAANTPPDEMSNAEKMYVNSQGSPARNIPPRPVIEPVMDRLFPLYADDLSRIVAEMIETDDTTEIIQFYRIMGDQCVRVIKSDFTSPVGGRKKNAEATEEGKEGPTPLIDTGSMMKAISFKVIGAPERKKKQTEDGSND